MRFTKSSAQRKIYSNKNFFSGYTLIELLVGISIVAIVFSIGVANYRDFSRREVLNGISKQLRGDLRTAQQLSLTGKKPTTSTCTVLNGYTFSLNGSNGYKISASCTNGGVNVLVEYKVVDLGSDVTITSTNSSINFKVLGQGTNLSASNTFTLRHSNGNQTVITLGVGGDVY